MVSIKWLTNLISENLTPENSWDSVMIHNLLLIPRIFHRGCPWPSHKVLGKWWRYRFNSHFEAATKESRVRIDWLITGFWRWIYIKDLMHPIHTSRISIQLGTDHISNDPLLANCFNSKIFPLDSEKGIQCCNFTRLHQIYYHISHDS